MWCIWEPLSVMNKDAVFSISSHHTLFICHRKNAVACISVAFLYIMFFLVFKCKTIGIKKRLSKKPQLRKGIPDTDKVSGIFLFVLKKLIFRCPQTKL